MKKKILKIIQAVQESFSDASYVYTLGGCYGFYTILKAIFPQAKLFATDDEKGHLVTKIGNSYYDIRGEWVDKDGKLEGKVFKLTKKQELWWKAQTYGQRVERMLNKLK